MRKFQILRYLKNLRYLIIIVTLAGAVGIYWYAQRKQMYTAEAVIKYTNATAASGTAPDGTPIDPEEIYSAAVITDVINELGLNTNVDQIRSACSVSEVITEDEERRKNALLDEGEEFTDFIPTYRITFSGNSSTSRDYVRKVLDSIINQYYIFYNKKYVDTSVIPNNVLNVSADTYDYINCIEMIEESVDDITSFLASKRNMYPNFRSAETGYSFEDLQQRYEYISNNNIPELYAIVFGQRLTKNHEALVKNYQNRLDNSIMEINNLDDHIEKERAVLDQLGDKVTKSETEVAGAIGDNTDAIIEDVDDYREEYIDVDTTYDEMINYYVSLCSDKNKSEMERDYCRQVLSVFDVSGISDDYNSDTAVSLVTDMNELIEELNLLYDAVEKTSNELNEYSGANHIATLSGTYVTEAINLDLYVLMALVLFFVIGCVGAVVLGRAADFWQYYIYVDKKTGIANRARCDDVIDEYGKRMLADNFSCIVFKLKNLQNANVSGGRRVGDAMLKRFGSILSREAEDFGFVGYNNGDMFIALFENCSRARAEGFVEIIKNEIPREDSEEDVFGFDYGIAETSQSGIYEIRKLLAQAIKNVNEDK